MATSLKISLLRCHSLEDGCQARIYSNAVQEGRFLSPGASIDYAKPLLTVTPWKSGKAGLGYGSLGSGCLGFGDAVNVDSGLGFGNCGYGEMGFGGGFVEVDVEDRTGLRFRSGVYLFRLAVLDRIGNEYLSDVCRVVVHARPEPPAEFSWSGDEAGKPVFAFRDSPDFGT